MVAIKIIEILQRHDSIAETKRKNLNNVDPKCFPRKIRHLILCGIYIVYPSFYICENNLRNTDFE